MAQKREHLSNISSSCQLSMAYNMAHGIRSSIIPTMRLDQALSPLWDKIRHYPARFFAQWCSISLDQFQIVSPFIV